jgi:hypothetical protein
MRRMGESLHGPYIYVCLTSTHKSRMVLGSCLLHHVLRGLFSGYNSRPVFSLTKKYVI